MKVMIGVGSNSPRKDFRMEAALRFLSEFLVNCRCSSVYSTHAINGIDADYLNAVVSGDTTLEPEQVVASLKNYENSCDRNTTAGCVTIDLDLVMADGVVLRPRDMEREYFLRGYRELVSGSDQGPSVRI